MARSRLKSPVPRIALRVPDEAAEALGVSPDFFEKHIAGNVKIVRIGRGARTTRMVTVNELQQYMDQSGARLVT